VYESAMAESLDERGGEKWKTEPGVAFPFIIERRVSLSVQLSCALDEFAGRSYTAPAGWNESRYVPARRAGRAMNRYQIIH